MKSSKRVFLQTMAIISLMGVRSVIAHPSDSPGKIECSVKVIPWHNYKVSLDTETRMMRVTRQYTDNSEMTWEGNYSHFTWSEIKQRSYTLLATNAHWGNPFTVFTLKTNEKGEIRFTDGGSGDLLCK